jgi:hypothetical protein
MVFSTFININTVEKLDTFIRELMCATALLVTEELQRRHVETLVYFGTDFIFRVLFSLKFHMFIKYG